MMDVVRAVIENSYAISDAGAELVQATERVRALALPFFRLPEANKHSCTTEEGEGFRAFATEYTDHPDQPDLVECFSCSLARGAVKRRFPPGPGRDLYEAMLDVQITFAREAESLARGILKTLGLTAPAPMAFDRWSRLQVNYADMAIPGRDLLHVVHQDGDFLTLAFSTAPGLTVFRRDGGRHRVSSDSAGKLVVLAGEILSLVSNGRVSAGFHCVERCPDVPERLAILYFADADPDVLAQCTGGRADELHALVEAGWLRSGVAPVQRRAKAAGEAE